MKIPKKTGRWIIGIVLLVLLFFTLTGSDGLINLYRTHLEVRQMNRKIEILKSAIDSLKIDIEKLKSDTAYIERVAREKLGMAKKGEKVYKFLEEDK